MSSPRSPSPRVAPRTSRPSSYSRLTAMPSNFSSATNSKRSSGRKFFSRVSNSWSSSMEYVFERLSMGCSWITAGNSFTGRPATRRVGESGVARSGMRPLEILEPLHETVVFAVRNHRVVENVIAVVVAADLLAKGFDRFFDGGAGNPLW